jgi:DNA-binding NarL/FixJ family response regulator
MSANDPGLIALIADDDEFFRVALRSVLLNKLGFSRVIEATSLDEAIEHLSSVDSITLAAFDLAMPGMESAASLRAVRECYPATRVVMVSASKQRQDILLALEAGAHGYIPKGLGVAELSRGLQAVTDGTIYVPALMTDLTSVNEEPSRRLRAWNMGQSAPEKSLTTQQQRVLHCLVQGQSNKEIARTLALREGTVKVHMAALFSVLGVTSRSAAAVEGLRLTMPDRRNALNPTPRVRVGETAP